jgi:hypothetical protein
MNEWEFTAEAASWINERLSVNPDLPFSRAKCEQRGAGSKKRRDLTLLDKQKRVVLTGEVKLPYAPDGGSPYNAKVVADARAKALRAGVAFFFTWNVNECVLWETRPGKTSWQDQNFRSWEVTKVHKESHLESPMAQHAIAIWIPRFLYDVAAVLLGTVPIGRKSLDEKFIQALESFLQLPIQLTLEEMSERYKGSRFKAELDRWMRDDLGWMISDHPEDVRDNLESASKFACYALLNKLVFYEALVKRFKMDKIPVPDHIDSGEELRLRLEGCFASAKNVTGDYETVFGEEHVSIGNRVPFYSDQAVTHWRDLVNQIHEFDFSKLDCEVIGNIFERLIAPERRKKYGQFYTRVEVVDLINSFCIRTGLEKVMDPACGGGTFLVRAYARKRELMPRRSHGAILSDLFGVDCEQFATHLTTINLATRDLIDEENYPQVVRSDFFNIRPQQAFLSLPNHARSKGLGQVQHRTVEAPPLDAVVGNPPYIRQERIRKDATAAEMAEKPAKGAKGDAGPERGTKEFYLKLALEEGNAHLSGRSDIHCYFWPHAAAFLKNDGFLCFLTSSQWLDVEYGFRLQEWMLCNFEIAAIFESFDEPWFVGARVATTITILRKQSDIEKRMRNVVRFVQLRRPIGDILAHDGTTAGAVQVADEFRDEILGLEMGAANNRYRVRLVQQGDLWKEGVRLGVLMGKSGGSENDMPHGQEGEYFGGKWGVHLRAPDLWFRLLDEFGDRFVPLGEIADIRRGITSGKDCFFFPRDCSKKCLSDYPYPTDVEDAFGVPRRDVESGKVRLVECGEGRGEIRAIESEYLEPEIHSLMEVDGFTVTAADCARQILLVGEKRGKLRGKRVRDYIKWGESKGYHEGSTSKGRATKEREWYDLTGHERGELFWPMAQQYKHAVPTNDHGLLCNHNLFDVSPRSGDSALLAGILNSSWVVLSKFQYGRPVGVEGNLKTEVVDVKMMLVPDPTKTPKRIASRIRAAFEKMKGRKALQFLSERRLREMAYCEAGKERELGKLSDECELDMPDRWELDDAVLEMLGVRSKRRRRELIRALYRYLSEFFEWTRQKEEKAIVNKKTAARRGTARPADIAGQIFDEIMENEGRLLRKYDPGFLDHDKPFDTFEVPKQGNPRVHSDLLNAHGVLFESGKKGPKVLVETKIPAQDELMVFAAKSGVRGFVRLPHEEEECRRLLAEYERFVARRDRRLHELIAERTADETLQEKIFAALLPLVVRGKR